MIEFLVLVACCAIAFFVGRWAGANPADASRLVSDAWTRARSLFKRKQ